MLATVTNIDNNLSQSLHHGFGFCCKIFGGENERVIVL